MDRASTFADKKIVALLSRSYIPVAVDAWYYSRRQDAAGDFYRKVVLQREGAHLGRTTQGFYIFEVSGELFQGWNNRNPGRVRRHLKNGLKAISTQKTRAPKGPSQSKSDPRYQRDIPAGATVVDVHSRILKGSWPKNKNTWSEMIRAARGKDRLWILESERKLLRKGKLAESLKRRIVRFHFVDNTRGEPPMWRVEEVKELKLKVLKQPKGWKIVGQVKLESKNGDRGYEGQVLGFYRMKKGQLTQFDLVSKGDFFGCGSYTPNPPEGKFSIGFATKLSDKNSAAYFVPPQAARDLRAYLK